MSGAHKSVANADAATLAWCGRIFLYGIRAGLRSFADVSNLRLHKQSTVEYDSQVSGDYLQTAQTWANAGVVLL